MLEGIFFGWLNDLINGAIKYETSRLPYLTRVSALFMQQEKCREPHHVSPCSRNFKGLHLNKYGVQFQGFPLCILPFIYNVYEARPTGPATGSKWTTVGLLNYEGKIITITII